MSTSKKIRSAETQIRIAVISCECTGENGNRVRSEKCDQKWKCRDADENLVPGSSPFILKCKSTESSRTVLRAVLLFVCEMLASFEYGLLMFY
jgi:hypothetical protein